MQVIIDKLHFNGRNIAGAIDEIICIVILYAITSIGLESRDNRVVYYSIPTNLTFPASLGKTAKVKSSLTNPTN